MGRVTVTVVNIGVLIILFYLMRFALANKCPESYSCTKIRYRRDSYRTKCGLFNWKRCTRYRSVSYTNHETCQREICCRGYTGTACETPLCFGGQNCPNAGTCVSPDKCACRTGYSNPRCADINECVTNNGGCQHKCTNTIGSFRCSCRPGFLLGKDGKTCSNINECASNKGGCETGCTDLPGSYKCTCNQGYDLNPDKKTCYEINECEAGTSGCAQICKNTPGSFTCSCRTGYVATGKACEDIDECVSGTDNCVHVCTNTEGSYQCSCNEGFQLNSDGTSCSAIPQCSTEANTCEQVCVEEPGSFKCQCRSGYRLNKDGITCSDIDECDEQTSQCTQTCDNTVGSFTCSCSAGFHLEDDGLTCTNIDDCLSQPCQNGGSCVDHVLRYTCNCVVGYTGQHCQTDINECDFINGGCQHVCADTVGSFTCSCNGDTTLALDGFSCIGGTSPESSIFRRGKLARKLLPRGCHDIVLTSCPDGNDIEIHLSSTSQWYRSLADAAIIYSPGVVFAEVNDLALPVSLSGVTVHFPENSFSISLGVSKLTPSDGTPVGTTRSEDCLSLALTPADVFEFISANSFLKTIFDRIFAVLPDFLQLTGVDSSILEVENLKTDFIYGIDMDVTPTCEGAPVIDNHIYSVFRFNTAFELSIYGNTVNIPKPLTGKRFCLIVDICHNYGGTLFLMIPEGSRDLLMEFEFFRKLKDKLDLSILPRGIGISLVKGVNVHSFDTQLQLWNGDHFFTYPTFARGDVWLGGDIQYSTNVFDVTAEVDSFLSVPNPGQVLTAVFIEEWNVLVHAGVSQADLKFSLFGKDYTVKLIDLETTSVDVYLSIGGSEERKWCGDGSPTDIANPPGAFFSTIMVVNPFQNIPILGDWLLKTSTRLHGYFTTDTLQTISPNNTVDVMDDILKLNETLDRLETFLYNIQQNIQMSFLNATLNLVDDIKIVVEETKTILLLHLADILQGNIGNLSNLLPQLWAQFIKIKNAIRDFIDSIEFIISDIKEAIIKYLKKELEILKQNIENATQKLSSQVTSAVENYSAFGGKFAIYIKIFGLDLGELDIELSISNDIVARCSRFSDVYDLLKGEKAIRILARYSREARMGFFLIAKAGAGLGGAFGMETNNVIIQLHAYIKILGFSTTADVFLSRKGLHVYLEGNVWNIFLAQIDMTATLGDEWYKLTYTLKGRFVAKARRKRQIQSQGNSYQASYLDALKKITRAIADGAEKRLSQVQDALSKAQNGLTKAQDWLEDKKDAVRKANGVFDAAVAKLESAKQKLEAAKGPFEQALRKLSAAQRKVDNLCRIRSCRKICIPGIKCRICHKRVWGVKIPYPCCRWTSCMISFPDPICIAANLICRGIRALAYIVLEAAKLFVRVPMLALDIAKALVSAAQVIVDKSRIILDVVIAALDLAKGALGLAKGILEAAKITLEAVKYAIRGALKVLEFVIEYGLQSIIDVRNCGFEVQISTTDLPVFEVSCEVNAFKLGWKTVKMRIDFRNALQTIWRAAKAAIDAIVSGFKNIFGRKKREVAFETSLQMHKLLRKIRQTGESPTQDDITDILDVTDKTTGMNKNISNSYESRVKWYGDKCDSITWIQRYLIESFGALHDIANESKSSMEIPENITEAAGNFDFENIMKSFTLESAEIGVKYGERVYLLKRDEMEAALLDAKRKIHNDPVAKEVQDAKKAADEVIKEEIANADTISIIDHWKLAMLNNTNNYFEKDECSGFEDCLLYAISNLYQLYEDEYDLPNIRTIKELVSDLETEALAILQSDVKNARATFELTESVYTTILALERLNVFCSEAPRFTTSFKNSTVIPGSNVRIDCNTVAQPAATVWWFKDGILLPDQTTDSLSIMNATEEDTGVYMCVAGNIVANITSPEMTLSVVKPEELCLAQDKMTLVINDEYCRTYLHCNESGVAQPMCCRSGRRYDETEDSCVATDAIDCIQEICPDGYDEECRLVAVPEKPTKYRDLDAHESPEMRCAPGTFFTPESCGCGEIGNDKGCKLQATDDPTTYYDTKSKKVKSCPKRKVFVKEECKCQDDPDIKDGCKLQATDDPTTYYDTKSKKVKSCPKRKVFVKEECKCQDDPDIKYGCKLQATDDPTTYYDTKSKKVKSCSKRKVFVKEECKCQDDPDIKYDCELRPVDGAPNKFMLGSTEMTCGPGTIFNLEECTCVSPPNLHDCELRPVDGAPNKFILGSTEMTCGPGTIFSLEECTCVSPPNLHDCELRPVDGAPNKFMLGSTEMTCGPGTIFSLEECTCVSPPNLHDCELRPVDGAPNKFMLGSTEMTCGPGTIFNLEECTCVSPPNLHDCELRPVDGAPNKFMLGSTEMTCGPGTIFNLEECTCVSPPNLHDCELRPVDEAPHKFMLGSTEMTCGPGTIFNLEECTCVSPPNLHDCELRPVDGAPNKFMLGSTEMTCGPGTIFNLEECTCVSPPNLHDCELRPVDGAPNKFMLGSTEMTCGPGTIFNLKECTCVSPPNLHGCWLVPVPGHPEMFLNIVAGVTFYCPGGTVFNPSICACDFPRKGRKG